MNAPTTGRRLRRLLLCTALVLAPVAASASAGTPKRAAHLVAHVTFAAPAGLRPAGQLTPGDPFDAVLPSGRIVRPVGTSVVVGAAALGLTVTPNGRYAVVADGAGAAAGSALYVVDLETMRVVDQQLFPADQAPSTGLLAVTDPVDATKTVVLASGGTQSGIALFDLDAAGRLMPDATAAITTPNVAAAVAGRRAFVSSFVPADNGRYVFAVDSAGDQVVTINVATRTLVGTPQAVGFTPFGAALAGPQLVISNEGLIEQNVLATPASAPIFAPLPWAPGRSSSLSLLQRGPDGSLATATALQMDPEPDGVRTIGGAHPSAVAATPNGKYAFVAMSNVDRIATVALTPFARVIGGTELRLYDRGPYGTQPAALAISRTGARVYVALLGIDAVAVLDARDPRRIHRLGLLPTGWQPTALALSPDGRTLYVANARGAVWRDGAQSTLQRIDLTRVALRSTTRQTLSYERTLTPVRPNPIVPQLLGARFERGRQARRARVRRQPNLRRDAWQRRQRRPVGGIRRRSVARPVRRDRYAESSRARRTFALAGNFYADAADPGLGDAISSDGIESAYTLRIEEHGPQRRALRSRQGSRRLPAAGLHLQQPARTPRDLPGLRKPLARIGLSCRWYVSARRTDAGRALRGTLTKPIPTPIRRSATSRARASSSATTARAAGLRRGLAAQRNARVSQPIRSPIRTARWG